MKILVTGADGFVGRHMIAELLSSGHFVIGTALSPHKIASQKIEMQPLDVCSRDSVYQTLSIHQPDAVVHLAGLAHTKESEFDRLKLFKVNVEGVTNVCSGISQILPNKLVRFLMVSSAFVYDSQVINETIRCNEATLPSPRGPYGESKLAAESSAKIFSSENLKIYIVRPFNHIGPGQSPSFAVPAFAARILSATSNLIDTGNLNAVRDFTDVRDIVRCYRLILEKTPQESLFVLGSGQSHTMQDIFTALCKISGKNLSARILPGLARDNDDAKLISNPELAQKILGWQPQITIEKSLQDILQELSTAGVEANKHLQH